MKVLITGGTGTISSGLVEEAVNQGYETYAITRGSNNQRNIDGAIYLHADIWNTEDVKLKLGELYFDVVVECLAYDVEQMEISLINFSGRCKQYVFVSTAAIYNRINNTRIRESDKKEFTEWSYTKDKIECENYLKDFSSKTGLKYTIVRPTVTYGDYRVPFPIATRTPGWTFFDRMIKGQPILAVDNVLFSIIHITDFSKMVVALFDNEKAINEDFHITSNKNDIYWDDVVKVSGEILNVTPKVVHVPEKVIKKIWPLIYDEIKYHKNTTQIFEDEKIRKATNIEAKIPMKSGMKQTIAAMKNEFESNNLTLDENWNIRCDAAIYYAYKKHLLMDAEMKIASDYIRGNSEKVIKNNYKIVMRKNITCNIKNNLKRIIGR